MQQLELILRNNHLRLTYSRQQVFETIRRANVPITTSEIAMHCQEVDRASVYRIVETFAAIRVITPVYLGGRQYYELAEPFAPHHHHLFCKKCRNAQPLQSPELEKFIDFIGKKYHFQVTSHQFELEGICARCQLEHSTQK